jgi:hypothetical protein
LRKDRLVEDFLRYVEPRYNSSLEKMSRDSFDQESILSIAGFVAYILASSPAGMRIFSDPLKAAAETHGLILDRDGEIPPAPEALEGKSFTELLKNGTIHFRVDPKFPQALGIRSILAWVSVFGNSQWEILHNDAADTPFFTSDFPIGLESSSDPRVLYKLVPLAPHLAIRIRPDIRLSGEAEDLSFSKFRSRQRRLRRQEVIEINRCIVRCAEDIVFFRDNLDWIVPFITKNRHYRVEGLTQRIQKGRGFLLVSTQRIASTHSNLGLN